jgi:hypothetical protein
VNAIKARGYAAEDNLDVYEKNIYNKECVLVQECPRVVIDHTVDKELDQMTKGSNGVEIGMNEMHDIENVERS